MSGGLTENRECQVCLSSSHGVGGGAGDPGTLLVSGDGVKDLGCKLHCPAASRVLPVFGRFLPPAGDRPDSRL